MNSFSESKYSGFQAYYSINNNESKQLACNVQRSVSEILQPSNTRTVKSGKGLYLLDKTSNTAVLLECGFLSNPEECEKLSEKEYQKQLSLAIVCGIIEYKENINQGY